MTGKCLRNFILTGVENDIVCKIDVIETINNFAYVKSRKKYLK